MVFSWHGSDCSVALFWSTAQWLRTKNLQVTAKIKGKTKNAKEKEVQVISTSITISYISQNAFECCPSCCIRVIWDQLSKWETIPCLCLLLRVVHQPGSLVLLRADHSVLDGFVDQSVHVGCEGINGCRQSLTALRHKLLSLCIHTKLHLTERQRESTN